MLSIFWKVDTYILACCEWYIKLLLNFGHSLRRSQSKHLVEYRQQPRSYLHQKCSALLMCTTVCCHVMWQMYQVLVSSCDKCTRFSSRHVTNVPGSRNVTNVPGSRHVTNVPGSRHVTSVLGSRHIMWQMYQVLVMSCDKCTRFSSCHVTSVLGSRHVTNVPGSRHVTNVPGSRLLHQMSTGFSYHGDVVCRTSLQATRLSMHQKNWNS